MKCPKCELITSENRDECPRCGLVFNAQKKVKTNPIIKKRDFSDIVIAVEKMAEKKNVLKRRPTKKETTITAHKKIAEENNTVKPSPTKKQATNSEIPQIDLKTDFLDKFGIGMFASKIRNPVVMDLKKSKVKKASSTDLEALTALTEHIELPKIITIQDIEWKKCEIEMAKIRIANEDLGFVDVFDLREDNEIAVLFELAEREILDPTVISVGGSSSTNKAIIDTNLDQAVKEFELAQDKDEALKRLNILDSGITTIISSDSAEIAKVWQRAGAFQIDFLLTLLFTLAFSWINIIPVEIKSKIVESDKTVIFELLPYCSEFFMTFLLSWLIMQCVLITTLGSTLGGKIFKIAITDKEGFILSFRHSLLRSLSWSVTIMSGGLGLLMFLLKHRQTLHDRVAKTIVVRI